MESGSRVERCLRVLRELHVRESLTTAQVARRLGVDREMARRDLAAIVGANVGVEVVGEGMKRRYRLAQRPALVVTAGEALALHFGRQLMTFLGGTVFPDWLEELTEKLAPSVGPDRRADRLRTRLLYVTEPYRDYEAHDGTVDTLLRALMDNREIAGRYGADRSYERLQPYTLVVYRRALFLMAHAPGSPGVLTLAVERLHEVALLDRSFRLPEGHDPEEAMRPYLGIWRDPAPEPVRLRFSADRAYFVRARRWHASALVVDLPDGAVELRMVAGGKELVNLALEWGRACEVIEPAWLREEVIRELEGARARYG